MLLLNPSLAAVFSTQTTLAEQTNVTSSPLGDLIGFTNQVDPSQGTVFAGTGFNTIFRPQSPKTPTKLPVPVPGSDNILELNLTAETLSFAAPLGNVPNRGFGDQGDITFNAVPYVQSINDITTLPRLAEVEFVEWTPDRHLRNARFVGFRKEAQSQT